MIAGRLNDFVTTVKATVVVDSFGAETITYTDNETRIRAEVKWKSGNASVQASEVFDDMKLEVLLRDAHEVAARWRIKYDGDTYLVEAVEKSRTKGYKRLVCSKVNL